MPTPDLHIPETAIKPGRGLLRERARVWNAAVDRAEHMAGDRGVLSLATSALATGLDELDARREGRTGWATVRDGRIVAVGSDPARPEPGDVVRLQAATPEALATVLRALKP